MKNMENEFGKIRVTDNYKSGEREQIKNWVKKTRGVGIGKVQTVYIELVEDNQDRLHLVSFTKPTSVFFHVKFDKIAC